MDDYVFGYGSLASVEELARQAGRPLRPDDWVLGSLRGYRRCWNVAMDNLVDVPGYKYYVDPRTRRRPPVFVTFLNLRPSPEDAVNGVLARVPPSELRRIDARERNYERIDVTDVVQPWLSSRVWTYRGSAAARERYDKAARMDAAVIDEHYYRRVQEAFRNHGEQAVNDYLASTDQPSAPLQALRTVSLR